MTETLADYLPRTQSVTADALLEGFLQFTDSAGIELYPAQEEAIMEIFDDNHVVMNTPTGSGKSMILLAACFAAIAREQRVIYTAPIKALVSEKFFDLCRGFGAEQVGLLTGDASVNRDAPLLCCTAEILANIALRQGDDLDCDWVVMDEFHYYSDRDRGVAWQVPLLALQRPNFVLMSATIGNPEFFVAELERRTQRSARLVQSFERPVPLDFAYKETPLQETIQSLVANNRAPVYVVYFSQRAASERAQSLTSLNFTSKEEKQALREELKGFRFDSPFGKELQRFIPHGIGVHHAGMLPKYRRLVERLAQRGYLKVICGTDTLGVGVNIPIRTVLFTQLYKFDGSTSRILSVRDFNQIAGRAGRKGFDEQGSVVVQAPEHEIENRILKDKAAGNPKKLRRLRLRPPPERGYTPYDSATLERLRAAKPEPLKSSFRVDPSMLLNVLARSNSCSVGKRLIRSSHEGRTSQTRLLREGMALFRSLVQAGVVKLDDRGATLHADLQQDFSLNQALSLFAIEAMDALDPDADDYALVLLSIIEAILENPGSILARQVALLKRRLLAELKAQGADYEERTAELERVEYPKPEQEFIYTAFNLFAKHHPWVSAHNIAPKSIARDMHEQALDFNNYVKEYGLSRMEGVLLRYLTDVYKALQQTVPEKYKTESVWDLQDWLATELRRVDASLLDEWTRLTQVSETLDQAERSPMEESRAPEAFADPRKLAIAVRNTCWRFVLLLARQDYALASEFLREHEPAELPSPLERWTSAALEARMHEYYAEYEALLIDADARSPARAPWDGNLLRQRLSDPDGNLDWEAVFEIDENQSRAQHKPVLKLRSLGRIDA